MDISGKELLELEASLAAVSTPLANPKEIQSHLQSWESERQGLREIINKDLAQANAKPAEKSTSSFASLSKLKLGSGTFLNKGASSEAKAKNDLMTRINGNRSRLDELDMLIKKEIQLRKQEEERASQAKNYQKAIQRLIANVFTPKLSRDDPALRTESWIMENIQKTDSQIHEASEALRYYQEALPLLKQAKDAIDPVIASNMDLSDSTHLQKVNHSALESSALIADTCLSTAWSSLSAADPGLELSTPTLPPLPDDVTNWIYQVKPIVKQLISETISSIQTKENEISHCKSKKEHFEEQLWNERRRVLIEAVNGPTSGLPPTYSEIIKEQTLSNSTHLSVKPQLPPRRSNERLDQTNHIPEPATMVKIPSAFHNEWSTETPIETLPVERVSSPIMSRTASVRSSVASYKAEPTFQKRIASTVANEWTADSPINSVSPKLSRKASAISELQRTPSVNPNEWTATSPSVPRTASPLIPQSSEPYVRVASGLGKVESEPEPSQREQTESVQASSFNSTLIEDNPWG